MTQHSTVSAETTPPDLSAVTSGPPWLAFTGLIPVILMVPVLLAHLYVLGVIVGAVGVVAVIGYHLWRKQGVSTLDGMALVFATVNFVLYAGFDSTWLMQHIDVVFYSLLSAQCAASLVRGAPWTEQFTKRTVVPEMWTVPAFQSMNVLATRLWTSAFVACLVCALTLEDPTGVWVPVVVMVGTAVVSRRLGRRHLTQGLMSSQRTA